MDDLISRDVAKACLFVHWFHAPVYHNSAIAALNVIPAADLSSPLGAVAMRDAAAAVCDGAAISRQAQMNGVDHKDDAQQQERWRVGKQQADILAESIRALPLPDHAALLAHAMKLPELAALVEALKWYDDPSSQGDVARTALAALESKP